MGKMAAARLPLAGVLLGSLLLGGIGSSADVAVPAEAAPRLRRPVALVLADGERWLCVANRQSGSISVIDTSAPRIITEVNVGRSLADLVQTPDSRWLLAVDEEAHEILLLSRQAATLRVAHRVQVPPNPVSVRVAPDGSWCSVASLWSRQLAIVDLSSRTPCIARTIDLPFAPREQLPLGDAKLAVADAFGGRLAVVDVHHGVVESMRTLPAHNIRGLALSRDGKEVWLAHQALNSRASTSFDDIHWGTLLTNNLRVLSLEDLLAPAADLLRGSRLHYLGDVGNAAGDPAKIAIGKDGSVVVALAGVAEIALGRQDAYRWQSVAVNRRPTAVAISPDSRRAYVANQLADSVSVVDLREHKVTAEISLGAQPPLRPRDRGEMLFYDARLSHDGWMSCHSCHTDGHSNGLLADTLGDGSFNTPKRVLSLLGVGDTGPYAWNGTAPDLESQVRKSILTTMHGPKPSSEQVGELSAYLRTLAPPPSWARLAGRAEEAAIRRGQEVFRSQSCGRCHVPPEYTSRATYDVGLADEAGNRQFNPPSLRGVSQGGPYFHDNRAATLEEIFTRHRHQLQGELPKPALDDLLSFLRSL